MTATLSRRHREESDRVTYVVECLLDPAEVTPLLHTDRAYSAYALAQLEPELFEHAEWYTARRPGAQALLLHAGGGLGRALFASGDPVALDAALSLHPGPRFTFGSFRPEHRPVIEKYFAMTRALSMLRMSVTPDTFRPSGESAVRLRGRDVAAVNRLYSLEESAGSYRPEHIERGVYHGVIEDGVLVAIAGTHAVSRTRGVAVVGNVFTHPRYRGQGLGATTTSATTQSLLKDCPLVVLTVEEGNESAVSMYGKLGYRPECSLYETPLIRKEPIGLLSLSRRLIARWRGRAEGTEVVVR